MKKNNALSTLALLGACSGLLIAAKTHANEAQINDNVGALLASGSLYDKSRGGCGTAGCKSKPKPKESQPYYYKKKPEERGFSENNNNPNRQDANSEETPISNKEEAYEGQLADAKEDDEKLKKLMAQNITYHEMTEEELLSQLNEKSIALYKSMSDEGKAIARDIASNKCNGTNKCKGQNACETEENKCAGQGSCKGKSKCSVSDANLAVKLAAKVMEERRANATKK